MDPISQRLSAQQIARPSATTPMQVVSHLGAIQAQDYLGCLWAVALRMKGPATEAGVEGAISGGDVIRIHTLRGTWQLVTPEDVRWMLELVGEDELKAAETRLRGLGIDGDVLQKSTRALEAGLRDGSHLTRDALRELLAARGIRCDGPRLMHLLWAAELRGVICNGARRGKQPTYALLDLRVPRQKRRWTRNEALAELARRYLASRSPATVADFTWWSGLSAGHARRAFAAAQDALSAPRLDSVHGVHLLPPFDEYLVGYRDRDAVLERRFVSRFNPDGGLLAATVIMDGRVVGTWRRALTRSKVTVSIRYFEKRHTTLDVAQAAERYGAFLGKSVEVRRG